MKRIEKYGFDEHEFAVCHASLMQDVKQHYHNISLQHHQKVAENYTEHFLYPEISWSKLYDNRMNQAEERLLQEIRLDQVNAMREVFSLSHFKTVSLQHFDENQMPSEQQIESIFSQVELEEILPRQKSVVTTAPLLDDTTLIEGKIVEQTTNTRADVTQIRFENGLVVLLKPLLHQKDMTLISVSSQKGLVDVPLQDVPLAKMLKTIIPCSGYGAWSMNELIQKITGQNVGFENPTIDTTRSSFQVCCHSEGLELQLQLIHLIIAQPKCDLKQFNRIVQDMRKQVEQSVDPEINIDGALTQELYGDHPLFQAWTKEMFENIDSNRAVPLYRCLLGDSEQLKFEIIGGFEVEQIVPLLQKYLGSIPRLQQEDKIVLERSPVSIFSGKGVQKIVHRKYADDQSNETRLAFLPKSGIAEQKISAKKGMELHWLQQILSNSLTNALRLHKEEKAGIYAVSVTGNRSINAQNSFKGSTINVEFSADPEEIDNTIATIFQVFAQLQKEGPSEQVLTDIRQTILREAPSNLESAYYWDAFLKTAYKAEEPLDVILDVPQWAEETLQVELMRKLAQEWLDTDCFVQLTLLPKQLT